MDGLTKPARRARRLLVVSGLSLAVLGATAAGAFVLSERLGNNVARMSVAFTSEQDSLRPPDTDAETFLLVGTSSRSATTDTIMIAQISPDRERAAVVSLPAGSWVDIPGRGSGALRSAYSGAQPATLVRTVEDLTAWRVDHVAVVDFAKFAPVIDSVDGIDVAAAGPLDGEAGTAYLERTDPDQSQAAQRQMDVLRAVLGKVTSNGMAGEPARLYDLMNATSRSVTLDDTFTNGELRSLAFDLRDLRPADVTMLDAPGRSVVENGRTVVHLDSARDAELWQALRSDRAAEYAGLHPEDVSGSATD